MQRLSSETLGSLNPVVTTPDYNRSSLVAGIVHFGAGNFHRAHQAVYCDALLNLGETEWAITGVSLRSPSMRDNLAPQDYLYSQLTLGENTSFQIIGAIKSILVAPENPSAVLDAVAKATTQLVTMTITEKGYCLNNGAIDTTQSDIQHDQQSLAEPRSIYGYLAAALIQRFESNQASLTILCCDNITHGGAHLKQGVTQLLQQHAPQVLTWVAAKVSFCASMVDRVTPATTDALKQQVADKLGVIDQAPVAAEPFTQWVIEDKFSGKRPPFDKVGATFVDDIAPYERVKLRFLNAGHSMLAALGYLAGDRYVHEALQRPLLADYTENTLKHEVLPAVDVPQDIDGTEYIDQVLARFRNANLPYACLQVGTDSSQKIQQRWFPSIDSALIHGARSNHLAFALAAWVVYIRQALQASDLNDPRKDDFAKHLAQSEEQDVHNFLTLAGAEKFAFFKQTSFMAQVKAYQSAIAEQGVEVALQPLATS
ncbi:mannitol dehydrogenase family protein [Gilvimarinus sp. 1_MG-2023]|uniref:mannitol dehydrogenase family protein n=1 Tax=Gilvimarinus sp. 1_MG-2023 TaxID=3062638 RepID=UPI0026E22A69|nr:mannitol dehydrogenase family protein [Gilvimarinus sp. 1_MG-2023]MDO6746540.1 mannitol dehydrogenase family protein [Gilvimarinus sp. 1_MG-2023]